MRAAATLLSLLAIACGSRTAPSLDPLDAGPAPVDAGPFCPPEVIVGVGVEVERPTVMWLLDRSGSMGLVLGDSGLDRTAAVRVALVEALPVLDPVADMGAIMFPGLTGGLLPVCDLPREASVALGPDRSDAIVDALDRRPPHGGTPTADSLRIAHIELLGTNLPTIVLVTDGGPNCHPDLEDTRHHGGDAFACIDDGFPPEICFDDQRTLRNIVAAREDGITTYVVGMDVDIPLFTEALDQMAVAGGRPRDGETRFYDVGQPDQLREAFEAITAEIVSCRFRAPTEPGSDARVRIDGSATDEWTALGSSVELTGSACERAREGGTVTYIGSCL